MATDFNAEVNTEITSETKLTTASGRVANFAYDSDAYDNDTVAGVEEYDYDNHQNIPLGDATILNTDSSILNKGVRSQASSLTRMMLNHFLGRSSFNVNKLADHLKNFLTTFKAFIKEGSNEWSPTVIYEEGDVVYFMTTLNHEPCKRTFKCIVNCPSVNLPPVYTDGSLINTTYWKELSGRVAGLTVGATNSGKTNVATFNGSITVSGDITQSGTPYETHAEQIYTKKDNIITREDATGALPSGDYSGIKVNNYDGNGANGILAYRSDGTAVVGDESGSPAVENLQPLLTRDEAGNIANGAPLVWDAANKRAIGGSTSGSGVPVITTATTTVNNIPLSNNDSIQLLFTADIFDTNATGGVTTGGVTPLAITYNNVSVPLKVSKNGVLTDIFAHEVRTNVWKYLQAYTVLDLIYLSDYDGNGNPAFIVKGNPILLSSSDYTIYANGSVGEGNIGDIKSGMWTTAPYGWLLCDGATYDTTKYSKLYDFLGTNKLPDLRECVLVGAGQSSNDYDASTNPNGIHEHDVYAVGEFKDDQLQTHTHGGTASGLWFGYEQGGAGKYSIRDWGQSTSSPTGRTGATTHGKQVGVNYCIKAL